MEVVADPQPFEAGLLGRLCLLDELAGVVLLGGQEVTDAHVAEVPPPARAMHPLAPSAGTVRRAGLRVPTPFPPRPANERRGDGSGATASGLRGERPISDSARRRGSRENGVAAAR